MRSSNAYGCLIDRLKNKGVKIIYGCLNVYRLKYKGVEKIYGCLNDRLKYKGVEMVLKHMKRVEMIAKCMKVMN